MFQKDLLKDKTIIVTGGGTGLGLAMGTRFSELGANLVITSRRQDVLDQSAKAISAETGGKVLAISTDIREPEQVQAMVKKNGRSFR